jgi:translation initiation factor 2-alpha kinase 4
LVYFSFSPQWISCNPDRIGHIDANGDCKIGDFGLATSSLAAVDPSDVTRRPIYPDADMTLGACFVPSSWSLNPSFLTQLFAEVGTRLYIAPEVMSRKKGPRDHSKADMYSLGVRLSSTLPECLLIWIIGRML